MLTIKLTDHLNRKLSNRNPVTHEFTEQGLPMNKLTISFCNLLLMQGIVLGALYQELIPGFNRIQSHVTVREIGVPTSANLDYAAYDRNPLLLDPVKHKPAKVPGDMPLKSITFGGLLSEIKNSLGQTPLSPGEKVTPLAWNPLLKKLWNVVKDDGLQNKSGKIAGYKWSDPQIYQPYQEISTLYIHHNGDAFELWVKVEFSPWVNFLKAVNDEDNDGFKEIYGKLSVSDIPQDSLKKAAEWIQNVYCTKILSSQECTDWITSLASYWYPSLNTDILDLSGQNTWPDNQTSGKIRKELKGVTIKNPLAVVEGKPFKPDNPFYNVFIIDSSSPALKKTVEKKEATTAAIILDTSVSENFRQNNLSFKKETGQFGSYEVWAKKNGSFFAGLSFWISSFPEEQMGLEGRDGWLFFRKSVEYMLGGDISSQPVNKNPVPHLIDFKRYLQNHNVNLLFVVVPNKEEVYFDKMSKLIPEPPVKLVNPYSRKILRDLQDSGIEVIDLLPAFLEAKKRDGQSSEPLYQTHDTHWTSRGLEIAAGLISERIKDYKWYKNLQKISLNLVDTTFGRLGDIVERIPENRRQQYKPTVLNAKQVRMPDGALYKGGKTSPVMLIGDSFTGIYELIDCKSAGIGSHIAYNTSVPVETITSWGGGPLVREKAMKARADDLNYKRIVVYLMSARDLFNYSQNWEPFPEKK